MDIDKLIETGHSVAKYMNKNDYGTWFSGQEYEKWKANCLIFMETKYPTLTVTKNLIDASRGTDENSYNKMMGILMAIKEME